MGITRGITRPITHPITRGVTEPGISATQEVPANAITYNGQPLKYSGQYLTYTEPE